MYSLLCLIHALLARLLTTHTAFNIENYLKYSRCIKIKILAFLIYIYIYNIYSVTQNGSSALSPDYSSTGQLLMPSCEPSSMACLPSTSHTVLHGALRQPSTGRDGDWPEKEREIILLPVLFYIPGNVL